MVGQRDVYVHRSLRSRNCSHADSELARNEGPAKTIIPPRKSRKGPWHRAKTIESGIGRTNAWLAEQGVLILKSLWAEFGHLR